MERETAREKDPRTFRRVAIAADRISRKKKEKQERKDSTKKGNGEATPHEGPAVKKPLKGVSEEKRARMTSTERPVSRAARGTADVLES